MGRHLQTGGVGEDRRGPCRSAKVLAACFWALTVSASGPAFGQEEAGRQRLLLLRGAQRAELVLPSDPVAPHPGQVVALPPVAPLPDRRPGIFPEDWGRGAIAHPRPIGPPAAHPGAARDGPWPATASPTPPPSIESIPSEANPLRDRAEGKVQRLPAVTGGEGLVVEVKPARPEPSRSAATADALLSSPSRANGGESGLAESDRQTQIAARDGSDPRGSRHDGSILPAVALSAGVSLALTALVICVLAAVLRQGGWRRGATIRVELADPAWPYRLLPAMPLPPAAGPVEAAAPGRHTSVADFAESPLPLGALGPTFAERRRKEEDCRKKQRAEVLQQIFEDNLSLHQGGLGAAPAAA